MNRIHSRRVMAGFTMVELMIAIVLGLIVSGAALTVFLTNRQTYAATESLGRIQESARTGFELMARDLRQAAGSVCGRPSAAGLTLVSDLNTNTNWYANWNNGIFGYDGGAGMSGLGFGTADGERINGTDAIELHGANDGDDVAIRPDFTSAPSIIVRDATDFAAGDIVAACDPSQMTLFQVTGKAGNTIVRAAGSAPAPGNATAATYSYGCRLGQLTAGACPTGSEWPASLAKLHAVRWYVGANDHGSRSLYRVSLVNTGGAVGTRSDEVAEGVQDLQVQYLVGGAVGYVDAAGVTAANWSGDGVVAIRMRMTVSDSERTGAGGSNIRRVLEHTITLRNRAP